MPSAPSIGQDEELATLRRQLRDVVALLALPAMWRGPDRDPAWIVASLADLLVHLMRLDLAYVRLEEPTTGTRVDAVLPRTLQPAADILAEIETAVAAEGRAQIRHPEVGTLHLARGVPGIDPEHWLVVVGCRRPDFPTDNERFLLRVAVEQAAITVENLRLYWEARQASEAKSNFLAIVSHELRTPLNAILGYVDLLLLGVPRPLPTEAIQQVERVRTSTHHLLQIIEEILTFSRIEAGREGVHQELVDLVEVVSATAALVEPLAYSKSIALRVHLPGRPTPVFTDPAKLRQILLNLLSNAIKFTEVGEVELTACEDGESVLLTVRDTGVGIPADQIERIFEPFLQVEQKLTRQRGGTGLGLSVTRQLTTLLGGQVTVESTPGQGSTFTVKLPLTQPQGVDDSLS